MQFNDNQIATYLFCARLINTKTQPLTIIEWNEVIRSLKKYDLEPQNLLKLTPSEILNIIGNEKKMIKVAKKIESRQQLGLSMFELNELTNQGYKIIFRQNMPPRIKKKIEPRHLPPFFYCLGDVTIFSYLSVGVVGSRDSTGEEIENIYKVGYEAANQGIVIVSGGARGIDHTAVDACLKNGGKAIVFPSDGLESWIKKKEIRHYIQNNQLLLVSSQHVNARFTGSYAMQRNKFIHTSSHVVLIGSSKIYQEGKNNYSGTWSGVLENIEGQWTPLFVQGKSEGVLKLLEERRAQPFTSLLEIKEIANSKRISNKEASVRVENKLTSINELKKLLLLEKKLGFNEDQLLAELEKLVSEIYKPNLSNENERKNDPIRVEIVHESHLEHISNSNSIEKLKMGDFYKQSK